MARKQDAGERKAVVEPEDAPLVRGGGADLDKAGDRDEVEPAASAYSPNSNGSRSAGSAAATTGTRHSRTPMPMIAGTSSVRQLSGVPLAASSEPAQMPTIRATGRKLVAV